MASGQVSTVNARKELDRSMTKKPFYNTFPTLRPDGTHAIEIQLGNRTFMCCTKGHKTRNAALLHGLGHISRWQKANPKEARDE